MTTQEAEVKSNGAVKVSVERRPGCHVTFNITVGPEAVEAAYVKAFRDINREVSIPGFRKGRAPNELIKERFRNQIDKEMRNVVVETALLEAMDLTKIYPLESRVEPKQFRFDRCSRTEGAQMTLAFETLPEIPSVDVKAIQLEKIEVRQVSQESIDQALENVRLHFREWEEINDRPVQLGDFVDFNLEDLEEPPNVIMSDSKVPVKEGLFPQWLLDLVIGMKSGESRECVDPTYEEQLPLKVTAKAVFIPKLPAVDDELAKKLGLETTEELIEKVTESLEKENEFEKERLELSALEQYLSEHYDFDLPDTYIKGEVEASRKRSLRKLKNKSVPDEEIEKRVNEMEAYLTEKTRRQLQNYFLFQEIAKEHNIEVTDEEVNLEVTHQLSLMMMDRNEVDFDEKNVRNHVKTLVLHKKVSSYLWENMASV